MQLVIPKHHGSKLADIPDDQLSEILPVVKKLVHASGAENYNILQNNGRLAHQEVDHVRKILSQSSGCIVAILTGPTGPFPHDSKADRGRGIGYLVACEEYRYGQIEGAPRNLKGQNVKMAPVEGWH